MARARAAAWWREEVRDSARTVVLLMLAGAGCHRGAEAPRPATPAPASPDAGVAETASAPADAAPILWDGICADNPLAHGCM